ncbi:hypothetical protein tinsulaeT_26420 [Thalassotalea insulae]|uniref:asparagine synthase (glutamine-hydrolyzing) n=1 Tax=Thalassotalea insulae TaxID=2056778 RepID=A0ABQ6GTS1_9GAMM|nr:asparagine synthase-related protein [Thalassotalea insulae]GLX79302.1 hypothetical protein tinsulaeT_26420 [Thalassotalea insulae]
MPNLSDLYQIQWGQEKSAQTTTALQQYNFITAHGCHFCINIGSTIKVWQDNQYFALFNGYHLNDLKLKNDAFLKQLSYGSQEQRIQWLKDTTGYFNLLIINKNSGEMFLARDKYGCKPLYYSINAGSGTISNYLAQFNRTQFSFDPIGLYESIHYRWLSGKQTLETSIEQIPAGYYGTITDSKVQTTQYWYWHQLSNNKNSQQLSLNTATEKVSKYLDEYFQLLEPQVNKVLIPLSGGVDSSILAAKAKQHLGNKCVAGIIEFEDENPELETAIYFANTLNMPYRLIKYHNESILEDCKQLVTHLEQLPRHYSSMPFYRLLNISDEFDAIIYGEPGDTFFGSHTIKRLLKQLKRMQLLKSLPVSLSTSNILASTFPQIHTKVKNFQQTHLHQLIHSADKIAFSNIDTTILARLKDYYTEQLDIDQQLPLENEKQFNRLEQHHQLSWIKTYMMITDIADHLVTAERLIKNKSVKLLTPLTYDKIAQASWQLSSKAYLGKDQVKEVLRKIGCQYYSKESMYAPKYGFNTPKDKWLKILNTQFVTSLKSGYLINKNIITQQQLDTFEQLSAEMRWTLYHLERYIQNASEHIN